MQEAAFEVSLGFRLQIPHLGFGENKKLHSSVFFEHVGYLAWKYHPHACLVGTAWSGYVLSVDDESLRVVLCQKFYLRRLPRF
jgi:hypothetical protein